MFPYTVVISVALGLIMGGAGNGDAVQAGKPPAARIEAGGGGGRCPQIYAPVTCDNGKTYPNQCEADRHHAKNCVPTGEI